MLNLTIAQIQAKIDSGELTYKTLTSYYLDRVEAHNDAVNAVSELNPNALEIASSLDEEFATKGRRSLLHGIPVMIKDNINITSDDFHTTAGAIVLKDFHAPYDATIVSRLKEAGAIIIGKTNLSEFANFIAEDAPNGFSALKGQVKNPYGEFDVGGSSSGSGVAVACGFCQVAIGTETSGSIISPASSNSILGLKPTVGVVSRYGIVPISATQDVPGPMGRHVDDLRVVEDVIEGFDSKDMSTAALLKQQNRYLTDKDAPLKKRLGLYVHREYMNDRLDANNHFSKVVKALKGSDYQIVEVGFNTKDYIIDWDVLYYEFPRELALYLATSENRLKVTSLDEIVALHNNDLKRLVSYNQKQFETSLKKADDFEEDYGRALRDSFRYGALMDQWIDDHDLDGVCYVNCDGVDMAARNGNPSITFPIGFTSEGKPVGFTISGKKFSEPLLMQLAEALIPLIGENKWPFDT